MATPNRSTMPIRHIAFIMDGNGRWAKTRGLPRTMGHKAGIKRLKEIITFSLFNCGIFCCSFFLFSCENFNRPQDEINFLFSYFEEYLKKDIDYFLQNKIAVKVVGDLNDKRIPDSLKNTIALTFKKTEKFENNKIVNLMFNYGGKQEIIHAINEIITINNTRKNTLLINENNIKNFMYTNKLPDVDLLIRTSGEKRISNFMLYYLAYTEMFFIDTYWPDFTKDDLEKIIYDFYKRNRRFGSV